MCPSKKGDGGVPVNRHSKFRLLATLGASSMAINTTSRIYIRGSHNNPSKDDNPRRFLDGLGGNTFAGPGSGRLEWAQRVADPTNPLTARVRANRLWKHLFGNGIVATTNDFGKMGTKPTHPELLDYLATDFMDNDWSLKHMIRKMVLTRAYRMSSAPSSKRWKRIPTTSYCNTCR